MDIGIVGGGINVLCCAWRLADRGHQIKVYERSSIMSSAGRASSKLLHGGLRYLENGEFRLVREALRERDAGLRRAPHLAKPRRLVVLIFRQSRRTTWMVAVGLYLYYNLAGKGDLPRATRFSVQEIRAKDTALTSKDLKSGFEFSDAQMDDHALGLWVADQATARGVKIEESAGVQGVHPGASVQIGSQTIHHNRVINIAGSWTISLLERSGVQCPYRLYLVRGSHLLLDQACPQVYLLEVPNGRRILFVVPWKGQTLLGTTEARQTLDEPIECTQPEEDHLLTSYRHYFLTSTFIVAERFAGLRPLLYSVQDPDKATLE